MIGSAYNVFVEDNGMCFIFNTKSLALLEIEKKFYEDVKNNNFTNLFRSNADYRTYLYDNGFLVDNLEDELNCIKSKYWENKVNSKVLHLSILTTLSCNFKCIYCFENRKNAILDEDTCEKILKFLCKNLHRYEVLHIDWYGGEPLLNMQYINELSGHIIVLQRTF